MEYGPVVVWWVLLVAIGVLGAPIASALLRTLPDRGVGVAIPVGLVVLWIPVYWLGHLRYDALTVGLGVLALAAAGLGLVYRGIRIDRRRGLEVLAVFTLGYLFLIAVRAADPAVHPGGGEKFLDYGLLNAVLRTATLPPEDMWFAGEAVRYYYGGHLIAGTLATMGDVAPRYAYNTALAGFYGMLVAGAYGLAGSIASARGVSYRRAGAAGAFLVGLASNLVTPLQAVLWALPDGLARPIAGAVAAAAGGLRPAELLEFGQSARTAFYWIPSRVIGGTINEFPLFAWLNGDLHAHMTSTPFLVTVGALAFAYYRAPAGARRYRLGLLFGAIPAVAGTVAVVNTWSFPSTAGLAGLAVVFAGAHPAGLLPAAYASRLRSAVAWRDELARIGLAAAAAVLVAILGAIWAAPFFLGPVLGPEGGRTIGLVIAPGRPVPSGPVGLVLVHGVFLAVFARFLAPRLADASELGYRVPLAVAVALLLGAVAFRLAALVLVAPVLLAGWYVLRRDGGSSVGFETVLAVAGAGLVLLVEVVYLKEQAGPGRLNTVFKTYAQVWVLWAIGAGAALVGDGGRVASFSLPERRGWVRPVLAVGLVVSLSLYAGGALGTHFARADEPTLDATRQAATRHPGEWAAIRFLDRQVSGQPNMVTAPGTRDPFRMYRWVNAPSSFTGIPTLAGWGHEVGYRGQARYDRRVAAVRTIYLGDHEQRTALFRRYDVQFVYVGPTERRRYGPLRIEDHPALEVVFRNDAVTIYQVNRTAL